MDIIISHDVDHLTVHEHFNDLIIPKFILRTHLEIMLGKISFKEYILRWNNLYNNKLNNIVEIIDFDEKNNIPSTFFVGVNNGLGLSYNIDLSERWIKKILNSGMDCGVHGIAFNNQEKMRKEYNLFKEISGLDSFGIRMHYLRKNADTLNMLSNVGYSFDSTDFNNIRHYKSGKMFEFPIQIMDSYELEGGKRWQDKSEDDAVSSTIAKIKMAENEGIDYLSIIFHDFYFNNSFQSWKNWYQRIVDFSKANGFKFINYKQAIGNIELEINKNVYDV